ncbi:MAG: zinc finger domain-containing protein [Candidatus Bathyarchaeota archaeon]|nr:zinc finger domain-containing protein [Candidatus Bathyarchaeota archaeon]
MPKCLSCGHVISPDEKSVNFLCPSCGELVIWRCEKCRLFGRLYKCPKCGFTGP